MSPEVPGKGRQIASVRYHRGGKQLKNSMCGITKLHKHGLEIPFLYSRILSG